MTRYLLNSAVMAPGCYGRYEYLKKDLKFAAEWLKKGHFESRIGYPSLAALIEAEFGVEIDVNRSIAKFEPGDECLVFRIPYRVGVQAKGEMSQIPLKQYEIGLIRYYG
ncbi:DUF1874 domain-containing protein [Candidatus Parcubacteria bacterium]|nr:MAG: DUF1874 domain-containing protein [Candidatus Parcubacteria bacterium]